MPGEPSSGVLPEEPQRNAKNAYLCATRSNLQPDDERESLRNGTPEEDAFLDDGKCGSQENHP